jgi:hypothetical protein
VGRSGLTDALILRIASLARAEGIDAERLAGEVADHLAQVIQRNAAEGCDESEAERRAIEGFGELETLVSAVACSVKGGAMRASIRTAPNLAALAATAALGGRARHAVTVWFNHRRLLEPIGYVTPAEFEACRARKVRLRLHRATMTWGDAC